MHATRAGDRPLPATSLIQCRNCPLAQIVVDAGTKNNRRQSHATNLVKAVQAAIPAGERLAAIACGCLDSSQGGLVVLHSGAAAVLPWRGDHAITSLHHKPDHKQACITSLHDKRIHTLQ